MDTTPEVQEFEYKAEMKQLLHLIIHSLYTHPEVFLRELISNASDALNKVRFMQVTSIPVLEPEAVLGITIDIDETRKTFSIEDNGIGMTRDDLVNRIGTVASSGTLDFIKNMKSESGALSGDLIGKFGVGFYSAFMVTDEITIETRHAEPGSKGYRWKSIGEGRFTIEEIEKVHRGTRIYFTLKDEAAEFASSWRAKDIIRKYSNFVDFPITIGGEKLNTVTALWQRPKDEVTEDERNEFYKFVSGDFAAPLGHLHLSLEGRTTFKALVFIPESAPSRFVDPRELKGPHLYASRVFIQDDCKDLIPEYLRFITGVVDSEDLPLNVSREMTQSSLALSRMREVITGRLLGLFEEWAERDAELYTRFWNAFGPYFKMGLSTDAGNKQRITELLRFETTRAAGALASLKEYSERMPESQKEIYYLAGEHRDLLERNPNLEYFRKHDLEVILLTDPIDLFVFPSLGDYAGKLIASIEKADLDFSTDSESRAGVDHGAATALLAAIRETLGDRIEDVVESKRLTDSAATLVVGKEGVDPQLERMMKALDKNFTGAKKILEINLTHPLIANLARLAVRGGDAELLRDAAIQVYEGALLLEQSLASPADFVRRMTDFMERATRDHGASGS